MCFVTIVPDVSSATSAIYLSTYVTRHDTCIYSGMPLELRQSIPITLRNL